MNLTDRLRGAQRKVSTFFVFNMFYTVQQGDKFEVCFWKRMAMGSNGLQKSTKLYRLDHPGCLTYNRIII